MDLQKNKFLVTIIAILLIEVIMYFWLVSGYSEKIDKAAKKVESAEQSINAILRKKTPDLKNEKWVKHYKEQKKQLLSEWKDIVAYYDRRDQDFEKYFNNLKPNFSKLDFYLEYESRWKKLLGQMKKVGIKFDQDASANKYQGFVVLDRQPADDVKQEEAQKGYWIQEALIQAMIQSNTEKFFETRLSFLTKKRGKFDPKKKVFSPPFHLITTEITISLPYHKLNQFLAKVLKHPHINFVLQTMEVKKQKFEVNYQHYRSDGMKRRMRTLDNPYFDRAYFHLNIPAQDYQLPQRELYEKYVPHPNVKVNLKFKVLDYDKKLLVNESTLTGKSKKRRRRRGRR